MQKGEYLHHCPIEATQEQEEDPAVPLLQETQQEMDDAAPPGHPQKTMATHRHSTQAPTAGVGLASCLRRWLLHAQTLAAAAHQQKEVVHQKRQVQVCYWKPARHQQQQGARVHLGEREEQLVVHGGVVREGGDMGQGRRVPPPPRPASRTPRRNQDRHRSIHSLSQALVQEQEQQRQQGWDEEEESSVDPHRGRIQRD